MVSPDFQILIVVCYILFVLPGLNKIDSGSERIIRGVDLIKWCRKIEEFQADTGRLPSSLYETAWYKGSVPPKVKVQLGVYIGEPEFQKLRDPNVFFQEVEYAFLVYPGGWYVIELKPGEYWKNRLMIDQDRKLYELRDIKQ